MAGIRERIKEDGSNKKASRYYSNRQEKQVAAVVSGTQTPNSGATPWIKSDVLTENFVLECKTKMSQSESIIIKKAWFNKQKEEMAFMGKEHSAIVFNFGPDEPNHYIIDEYLFVTLLEYLNKKE